MFVLKFGVIIIDRMYTVLRSEHFLCRKKTDNSSLVGICGLESDSETEIRHLAIPLAFLADASQQTTRLVK